MLVWKGERFGMINEIHGVGYTAGVQDQDSTALAGILCTEDGMKTRGVVGQRQGEAGPLRHLPTEVIDFEEDDLKNKK